MFSVLFSHNIYNEARTYVSVDSENLIAEFSKNIIEQEPKVKSQLTNSQRPMTIDQFQKISYICKTKN